MSNIKGTLVSVKMNANCKKSNGEGTFSGHIVKIETTEGEEKKYIIAAKSQQGQRIEPYLGRLNEGDEVTVCTEKKGNFENVIAVKKGHVSDSGGRFQKSSGGYSGKSSYNKGGYKRPDNTAGMIKGNCVTNGVALAISKYGKAVTIAQMIACAKAVLKVHEAMDKKSSDVEETEESDDIEEDEEPKKTKKKVTKDEDDDDEPLADDDIPF